MLIAQVQKSIGCSPCIVRIEGRDHGDPPLSSFTTITIHHKEENNHEPVITIKFLTPLTEE